jgi:hypothetical protein
MTLPLALSASSYNEDDASGTTIQNSKALYMSRNNLEINKNTNDSSNNTKSKNNYRKTIKQKQNVPNQSKLSALLKSMDEASDSEDDDNDNYRGSTGDGNNTGNGGNMPSNYLGISNGNIGNNNQNNKNNDDTTYLKDIPTTNGNPISNKMYDSLPSNYANQYYNQFVSAANKGYGSGLGSENAYDTSMSMPKNELIEKLNYIIDLLEEQQDYKTNSILEDLILYAFLGIFIIFIVDSFSKSNKYVR